MYFQIKHYLSYKIILHRGGDVCNLYEPEALTNFTGSFSQLCSERGSSQFIKRRSSKSFPWSTGHMVQLMFVYTRPNTHNYHLDT